MSEREKRESVCVCMCLKEKERGSTDTICLHFYPLVNVSHVQNTVETQDLLTWLKKTDQALLFVSKLSAKEKWIQENLSKFFSSPPPPPPPPHQSPVSPFHSKHTVIHMQTKKNPNEPEIKDCSSLQNKSCLPIIFRVRFHQSLKSVCYAQTKKDDYMKEEPVAFAPGPSER